ncbi:hypothetical protein ABZ318_06090 [Streptomyces sp. NPDC006197]|uniref:hypothetical protein n=1 Tax=Streptomyces sp. NPDC006197 TaxID=3156685 RepID=UPI0033A17451
MREENEHESMEGPPGRRGLLTIGIALLACFGLVGCGTLDGKGGQASCTLAIRDKHVQRATATGAFGRAPCTEETQTRQG